MYLASHFATRPTAQVRRLTACYIVALSIVALLSIMGQVLVQLALFRQSSDAHVIAIAGRQRTLSQEFSKAALALLVETQPNVRQAYIDELYTVVGPWNRSHLGLQHGDAQMGLPGNNSAEIRLLFATIEPNYRDMLICGTQLFAALKAGQPIHAAVEGILAAEPGFLHGMDAIVSQYDQEAQARVTQLKQIEVALLCITLVVLTLEGLCIFRPAMRRLRYSIEELVLAREQVLDTNRELQRKNEELDLAFGEALNLLSRVRPQARVIALGQYQVRNSRGDYYNVYSRKENGMSVIVCECLMYQRKVMCPHLLPAATLHQALLRSHPLMYRAPTRTSQVEMPLTGRR